VHLAPAEVGIERTEVLTDCYIKCYGRIPVKSTQQTDSFDKDSIQSNFSHVLIPQATCSKLGRRLSAVFCVLLCAVLHTHSSTAHSTQLIAESTVAMQEAARNNLSVPDWEKKYSGLKNLKRLNLHRFLFFIFVLYGRRTYYRRI
jgi:hypothetical protein